MKNRLLGISLCLILPQSCGFLSKIELPKKEPAAPTMSEMHRATTQKAVKVGKSYVGTPYLYGGTSRSGMDCSGFVTVVYQAAGIKLPRTSVEMSRVGKKVAVKDLQQGDLLFFATTGAGISHVALVSEIKPDGRVMFLHASTESGVRSDSLSTPYYQKSFVKAMRPFE
jgi:probable lipoprotein NlpC